MFSDFALPGNQGKQGDTPGYVILLTIYECLLCVRGSCRNSVISVLIYGPLPYDGGRGTQGLDAVKCTTPLANCMHELPMVGCTAFLHTFVGSSWLFPTSLPAPCQQGHGAFLFPLQRTALGQQTTGHLRTHWPITGNILWEFRDLGLEDCQETRGRKLRELKPACLSIAKAGSWKLQFNSQKSWEKNKQTNLNNGQQKKKERNPRAGTHTP